MSEPSLSLDPSYRRVGRVVVGGSPLRVFRLGAAGARHVQRLERGDGAAGVSRALGALTERLVDAGAIHPVPARTSSRFTRNDISVVTPVYNDTVSATPTDRNIIVDDGSCPPLAGSTIRLDHNRGPAAARNAGLGAVTTELVAFVDADVTAPPAWFDALLPLFDDDRVGLVAPRVRSQPGPSLLHRYEAGHSPLDLGPERARIRAGTRVAYVPAAAIVCRADALRSIGAFDESLRVGEDVDLCWRLDQAGWVCRYEPSSTVTHRPRSSWSSWVCQRVGYGSSAAVLDRRHPGRVAPAALSPWSLTAWVAAVAGHPLVGLAIMVSSSVSLARKLAFVPWSASMRLGIVGNIAAGRQLAAAIRRGWWPILTVLTPWSRTARRTLMMAALAGRGPVRVADDVAYSLGVWRGVIRERRIGALLPRLTGRSGRRTAAAAEHQ